MAIGAGEVGVFGVYVKELVSLRLDLLHLLGITLRKNQVTRAAIAGLDRLLSISRDMLAVMTTEAAVPVLVSDEIRMGTPVGFYFGKKVRAVDSLRFLDDWRRLGRVRVSYAQISCDTVFCFGCRVVGFHDRSYYL